MKFHFVLFLLVLNYSLQAKEIKVPSLAALQSAINEAQPGDIILLKDGVYTAADNITVRVMGTKDKPIIISAEHFGATEITGKGGFNLVSPCAYVVIRNFKFTHAASRAKSSGGTNFCRWTNNIFETPGEGENLTIAGNDIEVDHNTFQNKNAMGRFLAIRGVEKQIAERLWIHHNYFKTHKSQGGKNGAEAFQFGLSGFSLSSSNSIVEHNLLEDCDGENELISIKASAVILRYNTIRNCPAQFTLRHGNFCQVYGNYFINTPGLRFFGDDHIIHSNHFENCNPAIQIGNGGAEVADGAPLTSHDRPDRVVIAFNTLVNNKTNIVQSPRKDGLGSTSVTIVNNIIQGGGPAASIEGPFLHPAWAGNIIFQTEGTGVMPAGSFTTTDPKLVKAKAGTYHLQKGSPAINAAQHIPVKITVDMDGQQRTTPFDIGADEFSKAAVHACLLQATDVGASAANKK